MSFHNRVKLQIFQSLGLQFWGHLHNLKLKYIYLVFSCSSVFHYRNCNHGPYDKILFFSTTFFYIYLYFTISCVNQNYWNINHQAVNKYDFVCVCVCVLYKNMLQIFSKLVFLKHLYLYLTLHPGTWEEFSFPWQQFPKVQTLTTFVRSISMAFSTSLFSHSGHKFHSILYTHCEMLDSR